MSMTYMYTTFYFLKSVQDVKYFIELYYFVPFCIPIYGKVIMQALIEYVNSNSVIQEQQIKHRLEYKGKCLFLQLKIACHNACILKIYNRQ